MTKSVRQGQILKLLRARSICTQDELARALIRDSDLVMLVRSEVEQQVVDGLGVRGILPETPAEIDAARRWDPTVWKP